MKKFIKFLLITMIIGLIYNYSMGIVSAEEENDVKHELSDKVEEELGKIDFGDFENFVSEMLDGDNTLGTSVGDYVKGIIKGEYRLGFNEILSMTGKLFAKQLTSFLPLAITIVSIAILYSIVGGISSGFINKEINEILYFVCYSAVIIVIIGTVGKLLADTIATVDAMRKFMGIAFPVLLTLVTALGGVVSASAYQPMMAVLSGMVVSIITKFIIPCFIAIIVFTIVGNLSKNIKLGKITKSVKSVAEFVLGFVFSLFMGFVTLQGITGSVIDNISVKSAKFAISSYVPILGGYLSDGFDLVMASCVLIKNAVGFTGIVILLLLILAPVIKIALFSLVLKLVSGIIEPLADERMSKLVFSVGKSVSLLIVVLLGVAFMFFITVMLIIFTCNMGAL